VTDRTSVVIVGGGITGLTLAYRLARTGVPHIVVEAAPRVGGVIRSARVGGHLLEWGPQRTRLTAAFGALIEELGLTERVVTAPPGLPLFVYRGGKLRRVPFSPGEFLRTDVVSGIGKLRVLLEPFTPGPRGDESVASFLTRKLGREFYENVAGPLYGGLYASDPADMVVELSLAHALREFRIGRSLLMPLLRRGGTIRPPAACSFDEGLETLPRALYAANAANIRLATPARRLHREPAGWRVELDGSDVLADRVVITAPAPVAAGLLGQAAPDAADRVGRLRYNPLAVVHLHAATGLRGLGYQVSFTESLATRGVTFNDSLFARRGVYTAYLGGAKAPHVVDWADGEIAAAAVLEFQAATGFGSEVVSVERERMPAWDASWRAMSGLELPAGITLAGNWESRPGIPGRLVQAERLAAQFARELGTG